MSPLSVKRLNPLTLSAMLNVGHRRITTHTIWQGRILSYNVSQSQQVITARYQNHKVGLTTISFTSSSLEQINNQWMHPTTRHSHSFTKNHTCKTVPGSIEKNIIQEVHVYTVRKSKYNSTHGLWLARPNALNSKIKVDLLYSDVADLPFTPILDPKVLSLFFGSFSSLSPFVSVCFRLFGRGSD